MVAVELSTMYKIVYVEPEESQADGESVFDSDQMTQSQPRITV